MPTLKYHPVPPMAPPAPDVAYIPNQVAPPPSLKVFADIYLPYSEDNSVFNEMVGNDKMNPIKSISTSLKLSSPTMIILSVQSPYIHILWFIFVWRTFISYKHKPITAHN